MIKNPLLSKSDAIRAQIAAEFSIARDSVASPDEPTQQALGIVTEPFDIADLDTLELPCWQAGSSRYWEYWEDA